MPIRRLIIAFALFIGIMLVLVHYLTPDSWNEYGFYRGKALEEIADQTPRYMQKETCAMCHDSIAEFKNQGRHISLQCEICHGEGHQHVDDPEANQMEINGDMSLCLRCHLINPARPEDVIKQIDPVEHGEGEDCITCHNPHQPWL